MARGRHARAIFCLHRQDCGIVAPVRVNGKRSEHLLEKHFMKRAPRGIYTRIGLQRKRPPVIPFCQHYRPAISHACKQRFSLAVRFCPSEFSTILDVN